MLAWLAPYYVEKGWSEQNAGLLLGFLTAMEVISGLVVPAIANRSRDRRVVLMALLVLIIAGFCGLILSPQHLSLLWPCLLGLGIGGLFPMSLIVSLDHLDNPQRAGGLTAFVQGIGYLIAGLSPLMAGMIRDQLGQLRMGLVVADRGDGGDAADGRGASIPGITHDTFTDRARGLWPSFAV